MNKIEHLVATLNEEAVEIQMELTLARVAKMCDKSLRFGLDDRNVLDPTIAGILPSDWLNGEKVFAKKEKVEKFLGYAQEVGALEG